MNLYILTYSDHYYPVGGTSDWHSVHSDDDEARAAFEALVAQKNDANRGILANGQVVLIEVDAEGWRELEVASV